MARPASVGCGSMKDFVPVAPMFPPAKTPQGPTVDGGSTPGALPSAPQATSTPVLFTSEPATPCRSPSVPAAIPRTPTRLLSPRTPAPVYPGIGKPPRCLPKTPAELLPPVGTFPEMARPAAFVEL